MQLRSPGIYNNLNFTPGVVSPVAPSITAVASIGTPKITPVQVQTTPIVATASIGTPKLSAGVKVTTGITATASIGPGRMGVTTAHDIMQGQQYSIAAYALMWGTNRTRKLTAAMWGDSYTMLLQSGINHASVALTSAFAQSISSATTFILSLSNVADGLTDAASGTNHGSNVLTGAGTQNHNGYTTNGLLVDQLTALGINVTDRREYAIGGTTIGSGVGGGGDWLTGIPTVGSADWLSGTPTGAAGTNLWNTTRTSYDGNTNGSQGFADFLKTCQGDVLVYGTAGGNNLFAGGATTQLTTKDAYYRPTGVNTPAWNAPADGGNSGSVGDVLEQSLAVAYAWMKQLISLNPYKPTVSFCHGGYLNFPYDELPTNTPTVDLPHGTLDNLGQTTLGGTNAGDPYEGAPNGTDSSGMDRSGFWGTFNRNIIQTTPYLVADDYQYSYTESNNGRGTGRWDPEYSVPYHNPTTTPKFTWIALGNILSGVLGASTGWTISTPGMVKFLTVFSANGQGVWGAEWASMSYFYKLWWSHWEADNGTYLGQSYRNGVRAAAINHAVTTYGYWQNLYANLLSGGLEQLDWGMWGAVGTTTLSNDVVNGMFKGSLDPLYRRTETAQKAAGLDFTYVPTWDLLSTGRLGTPVGLGATAYRSGPKTAFVEGTHPNSIAAPIWLDKVLRSWLPQAKAVQGLITSERITSPGITATASIGTPTVQAVVTARPPSITAIASIGAKAEPKIIATTQSITAQATITSPDRLRIAAGTSSITALASIGAVVTSETKAVTPVIQAYAIVVDPTVVGVALVSTRIRAIASISGFAGISQWVTTPSITAIASIATPELSATFTVPEPIVALASIGPSFASTPIAAYQLQQILAYAIMLPVTLAITRSPSRIIVVNRPRVAHVATRPRGEIISPRPSTTQRWTKP